MWILNFMWINIKIKIHTYINNIYIYIYIYVYKCINSGNPISNGTETASVRN